MTRTDKIFWAGMFIVLPMILIGLKIYYQENPSSNDYIYFDCDSNDVNSISILISEPNDPNDDFYSGTYVDLNDYDFNFIPNIVITCESGKEVVIDFSGDEVKVTGACEEGAKIFFEELLKPMVDDYRRTKHNSTYDIRNTQYEKEGANQ